MDSFGQPKWHYDSPIPIGNVEDRKYSNIWIGTLGAIALFYVVLHCSKLTCYLQICKIHFEDGNHCSFRSTWDCCNFADLGLNKSKSTVLETPSLLQAGDRCSGASDIPQRLDKRCLHWHFLSLSNRFEETFQVKFCCRSLAFLTNSRMLQKS